MRVRKIQKAVLRGSAFKKTPQRINTHAAFYIWHFACINRVYQHFQIKMTHTRSGKQYIIFGVLFP